MDEGVAAEYAELVVNHGDPPGQVMLPAPRRALVRVELYSGELVILEFDVIARAEGYVCVKQERPGKAPWLAWVPAEDATPL